MLRLDDVERTYLLGLVAARPRTPRRKRPEHVPARVHELLAHLQIPAFVEGRAFDVLASNPMAVALFPRLRPGRNRLRDLLLDAEEQAFQQDWTKAADDFVAALRTTIGDDTGNPRFVELVDELRLHRDKLAIGDVILVVYYPGRDSDSDEKLRLLTALVHTGSAGTAHDSPADLPDPKTT
ncbi:hypothetical protein [Micromonospora sp. NPDC005367]|uniref:MmyB family transcriptional regulator n=1 Tax=Micromonospora sp. NPDC005367 TaxID=3155590 RepID=UPI00339FB22B